MCCAHVFAVWVWSRCWLNMWAASGAFMSKSQTGRGVRFGGLRSRWIKKNETKKGVTEKEWGASCQKTSPQYHRVCCSVWNSSRGRSLFYRDIWQCFCWPALNFPHSLSSPFCLVLLLLVLLFLQILCRQCAPPEALLRLYNHRNHLHLHRSGFNCKCCWVFIFFRWSFSSVCLIITAISILTYRSSVFPSSERKRFSFPISLLSVGTKTGGSCRKLLLKAMEEDNRLYRKWPQA